MQKKIVPPTITGIYVPYIHTHARTHTHTYTHTHTHRPPEFKVDKNGMMELPGNDWCIIQVPNDDVT